MRAGQYAVIDGVEYPARFRPDLDRIAVTVQRGQQAPEGFAGRPGEHGSLTGQLPRSRASRLIEVETWALLHGRFPVKVDRVESDGTAAIMYPLRGESPLGGPVRDERGSVVVPPGMPGHPSDPYRLGGAAVADLTDVREHAHDVPV